MAAADLMSDAKVLEISTIDSSAAMDDLEPLVDLIDPDIRVVAIGETAHAAHEYYALRHRLIRFLVTRLGFTVLAWESGFPEGFRIDDWIHGRTEDRQRALLDGMTMHFGRCQEMEDLLEWLKSRNVTANDQAAAGSIRFFGLDLPGSSAALRPALEVVESYVKLVDPGFDRRLARLVGLAARFGPHQSVDESSSLTLVGTSVIYQYVAIPSNERDELTSLLADLGARFDALRRTYVERSDAQRYDLARQHLRVATQLDLQLRAVAAFMSGDAAACEANIRDLSMAQTVLWLLSRHQRIVILAHNGHIQRTPISTVPGMTPVDTLGVHLAHALGDRCLTIGTTCGGGEIIVPRTTVVDGKHQTDLVIRDLPTAPADTIDSLLDSAFDKVTLVDLRSLGPNSAAAIDKVSRMRVLDQSMPIDIRKSFDMLIHVPRISLWTSNTNASLNDLRGKDQAPQS